ncbi:MAG: DUF5615 family PIN-like protein [Pyrinomonadaceae bacterium]
MKILFQADADFNHVIVSALLRREPGIEFQMAHTAQLERLPDIEVLAMAAREGRILVSHDRKTMPQHFAKFIMAETSPGLLIVPQKLSLSIAVEELLLIWYACDSEEWTNRIAQLPL